MMANDTSNKKRTRLVATFSLLFSMSGLILYLIIIIFRTNISLGIPSFPLGIMAWILAVEVKSIILSILAAFVTFSYLIFIVIIML